MAFHRRVRAGFVTLSKEADASWCVIDASRPLDDVARQVIDAVDRRLSLGAATGVGP
jgi:thymidylate kinase